MNKEDIVRQYIANRQRYLDGELRACRATIKDFTEMEDTTACSTAIGKLEGEINAYMNELTALTKFTAFLEEAEAMEEGGEEDD